MLSEIREYRYPEHRPGFLTPRDAPPTDTPLLHTCHPRKPYHQFDQYFSKLRDRSQKFSQTPDPNRLYDEEKTISFVGERKRAVCVLVFLVGAYLSSSWGEICATRRGLGRGIVVVEEAAARRGGVCSLRLSTSQSTCSAREACNLDRLFENNLRKEEQARRIEVRAGQELNDGCWVWEGSVVVGRSGFDGIVVSLEVRRELIQAIAAELTVTVMVII